MQRKRQRIAAADIGSNNIHLKIAEVDEGQLTIITKHEIPTRLSQDVDEDGRISPEKMTQVAAVLTLFKTVAEGFSADKFLCVATEATRASNNTDQFVDFVRDRTGVDVQVISREQEAALVFKGATHNRNLHVAQLVVDIGGGSTELVASNRHDVDWIMSIPIGSGRMTDRFLIADPPSKASLSKLRRYLDHVFGQVQPGYKIRNALFTGGTAQTMHFILAKDQSRWKLKRKDLSRALGRLTRHPANHLANQYQLDLARASTLAAGVSIAYSILNRFKLRTLRVSPQGLRSGLILMYAHYGDDWNKHLIGPDVVRAPSPLDTTNES